MHAILRASRADLEQIVEIYNQSVTKRNVTADFQGSPWTDFALLAVTSETQQETLPHVSVLARQTLFTKLFASYQYFIKTESIYLVNLALASGAN